MYLKGNFSQKFLAVPFDTTLICDESTITKGNINAINKLYFQENHSLKVYNFIINYDEINY